VCRILAHISYANFSKSADKPHILADCQSVYLLTALTDANEPDVNTEVCHIGDTYFSEK